MGFFHRKDALLFATLSAGRSRKRVPPNTALRFSPLSDIPSFGILGVVEVYRCSEPIKLRRIARSKAPSIPPLVDLRPARCWRLLEGSAYDPSSSFSNWRYWSPS